MVATPGTLYYLDPQTLEILHATALNLGANVLAGACAANRPRAVVATSGEAYGEPVFGGGYGNWVMRVYDLSSGGLLREWNLLHSPPLGDVAISPSGDQIAVSRVATNSFTGRPKAMPNLELFNVSSGKVIVQVKTGHLPGRVCFVGETRVATADTNGPALFWKPEIKVWDTSNGNLVKEFGDPQVGARRGVGASSDGTVLLGYIPQETVNRGTKNTDWTVEARFRLWDATTGQTIATSPPLLPIRTDYLGLGLDLSANGHAVVVFDSLVPSPIYVFSTAQSEHLDQ